MPTAPAWCAEYIGIPYKRFGRDRDGCDCWGLVVIVLATRFGYRPPAYEGVGWATGDDRKHRASISGLMASECDRLWRQIEPGQERPGDVVTLRIAGHPIHCGIVVERGLMLHTAEDADAAIEPYNGLMWGKRIGGFWRYEGERAAEGEHDHAA